MWDPNVSDGFDGWCAGLGGGLVEKRVWYEVLVWNGHTAYILVWNGHCIYFGGEISFIGLRLTWHVRHNMLCRLYCCNFLSFLTNARDAMWWPNLYFMQVAPPND